MPDEFHGDKTLLTSHETLSFFLLSMSAKLMILYTMKPSIKPLLRLTLATKFSLYDERGEVVNLLPNHIIWMWAGTKSPKPKKEVQLPRNTPPSPPQKKMLYGSFPQYFSYPYFLAKKWHYSVRTSDGRFSFGHYIAISK